MCYLLLVFITLLLGPLVMEGLPILARPSWSAIAELLSTAVSTLCLLLPYGLFLRPSVTKKKLPFARPAKGMVLPALFMGMAVASLGNLLSSIMAAALGKAGLETQGAQPVFGQSSLLNLVVLLGVTLVAALSEEVVFRGLLLQALRRWGDGFAILLSATVFALSHASLLQVFPAFLSGLVFGYFTVISHSLWPSILSHLCYNGLAVAINQASRAMGDTGGLIFSVLCTALLIALGGWCFLGFFRRRPPLSLLSREKGLPPPLEKAGAVFTSPVLMMSFLCLILNMAGSISH